MDAFASRRLHKCSGCQATIADLEKRMQAARLRGELERTQARAAEVLGPARSAKVEFG